MAPHAICSLGRPDRHERVNEWRWYFRRSVWSDRHLFSFGWNCCWLRCKSQTLENRHLRHPQQQQQQQQPYEQLFLFDMSFSSKRNLIIRQCWLILLLLFLWSIELINLYLLFIALRSLSTGSCSLSFSFNWQTFSDVLMSKTKTN